jgi:S-adenosylmethionine:tRNA ribosyltransferase-isomerase
MHPKELAIGDYTYTLPDEKIAAFPLTNRDFSKLLICKDGVVSQDTYQHIAAYLPEKSLLIFNNTRVIQARILFQKSTGGVIEIFCLEPYEDINEHTTIMNKKEKVCWKCMIGGAGKWKDGFLIKKSLINSLELKARLIKKLPDAYVVEFEWQPAEASFADVMAEMGDIPLPPYIKRKPDTADKERYQTIYAAFDGSVAAPTAGLHFTESVFKSFKIKNIEVAYVTLHVGAGTFKPVKANKMEQHTMHAEWMDVSTATIKQLVENIDNTIAAVGTTSLRTIESLYWMGVKTLLFAEITMETISISQWEVYEAPLATADFSAVVALQSLLGWMEENKLEHIIIQTQILIAPGYQFKIARAIITNFHQPQSTLLLLVAAAIGKNWKKVYDFALENDFRFLSYGDGSLLFISPSSEREHH